jgi:hypothetical protein
MNTFRQAESAPAVLRRVASNGDLATIACSISTVISSPRVRTSMIRGSRPSLNRPVTIVARRVHGDVLDGRLDVAHGTFEETVLEDRDRASIRPACPRRGRAVSAAWALAALNWACALTSRSRDNFWTGFVVSMVTDAPRPRARYAPDMDNAGKLRRNIVFAAQPQQFVVAWDRRTR